MAKFRIPETDGQRLRSGPTYVPNSSDKFGKQIEDVIAPTMPTASAYGLDAAEAEFQAGQAFSRMGQQIGGAIANYEKRQELLQQAEERTKARKEIANTDAAWEETKTRLKEDAYTFGQTAEEYQQSLRDAADELGYNASQQSQYKTKVGDDFNAAVDMRLNKYNVDIIRDGGLVESYRMDRTKENVLDTYNSIRQVTAANGTYQASMEAYAQIDDIYSDPSNVLALGGAARASIMRLEAVNEIYTDQIHVAIENAENLDTVKALLETKGEGEDAEYAYYPELDPKKRFDLLNDVNGAIKIRDKLIEDEQWYDGILEHSKDTGYVPHLGDPRYTKMVNKDYDTNIVPQLQGLRPEQRYAIVRQFINDTQTMPKSLKVELAQTFESNNPEEVSSALKFASDLVRDNPRMAEKMPEMLVDAAIMHQAGMTVDNVVQTIQVIRDMSPQQRDSLNTVWKTKESKETVSAARNEFIDGIPSEGLSAEYSKLYEMNFIKTRGNHEAAQALTEASLNKVWGKTQFGTNERWMKYAPEKIVPNAGDWMHKQLFDDAKTIGVDLTKENYFLVPTEHTIKTGQPAYYVMTYNEETGFMNPVTNNNVRQIFTFDYRETDDWQEMKIEKDYERYNAITDRSYKKALEAWRQLPYMERNKYAQPTKPPKVSPPRDTVDEDDIDDDFYEAMP